MSNQIALRSSLTPVPFSMESRRMMPPLTKAQQKLVELVARKTRKKDPITRDDIRELYVENILDGETFAAQVWTGERFVHKRVDGHHESIRAKINAKAMGWFTRNLSSIILKGKLIVVPLQ